MLVVQVLLSTVQVHAMDTSPEPDPDCNPLLKSATDDQITAILSQTALFGAGPATPSYGAGELKSPSRPLSSPPPFRHFTTQVFSELQAALHRGDSASGVTAVGPESDISTVNGRGVVIESNMTELR